MYIEPNTNIRLLWGVPLDKTYQHTIYFDSVEKQTEYFVSRTKYNLTKQSYQRKERGYMRVQVNAEKLYNCNYLMYQNSNFEPTRWFYAFITSVEYINNEVSEIGFEIDVMQTWFFDITLLNTFVEREHSRTDNIGDNILPEPLELGEYTYDNYGELYTTNEGVSLLKNLLVLVAVSEVGEGKTVDGNLYDGIYGGCKLYAFNSTDTLGINNFLSRYVEAPDSVVAMYMCPKALLPTLASGSAVPYGANGTFYNLEFNRLALKGNEHFDSINGEVFVPNNKKLYTYPYNFLSVDNGSGQSLTLRYEFFKNLTPSFNLEGCITQPVSLVLKPYNYKGNNASGGLETTTPNMNESLSLVSYPMCSWNTDAFKAWVAQNCIPLVLNGAGMLSQIGMNKPESLQDYVKIHLPDYTPVGSALSAVANTMSGLYTASIQADMCRGKLDNGNVNTTNGRQQFYVGRARISYDYAKQIDSFFDMYGYTTNKIKIPNRNVRPHWTYTKTVNCNVIGNAPADDVAKVCEIYDSGITFWNNPNEVGDYSKNNKPR